MLCAQQYSIQARVCLCAQKQIPDKGGSAESTECWQQFKLSAQAYYGEQFLDC